MKIYHFTLFFCMIAVTVFAVTTNRLAMKNDLDRTGITLDEAIDRACDAAAQMLRENGDVLTKAAAERAEKSFFASLCGYFDTDMTTQQAVQITSSFPVLAITCPDGCYVGYLTDPGGRLVRVWTEKISYYDCDPEDILMNYCNKAVTGCDNGRIYSFLLPAGDKGMFERNAHDYGFSAFFADNAAGRISYALSITRLSKKYYINLEGEGYASRRFYHVMGCDCLHEEAEEYDSVRECALAGAYVCPHCRNTID